MPMGIIASRKSCVACDATDASACDATDASAVFFLRFIFMIRPAIKVVVGFAKCLFKRLR